MTSWRIPCGAPVGGVAGPDRLPAVVRVAARMAGGDEPACRFGAGAGVFEEGAGLGPGPADVVRGVVEDDGFEGGGHGLSTGSYVASKTSLRHG